MVKMVQGDDVPLHHYAATLRCPRSENLMYAGDLLAGRGRVGARGTSIP